MKVFYFVLLVVFLYVVGQAIYMKRLVNIGTAMAKESVPYEQEVRNPKYHFLILGDSTAVGVGASNPAFSVAGRIGAEFPRANIVNLGRNGRKTKDLIPLLEELQGTEFDLVEIHIGGNDAVRFTNLDGLGDDLSRVIVLAKRLSDNVLIISHGNAGTVRMFPYGTRWLFQARSESVRDVFTKVTSVNEVPFVDLYVDHLQDPFAIDPATYYAQDYFHPSNDGYALWFEKILPALLKFGFEGKS